MMSRAYPLVATREGVFAYMQEEIGKKEKFAGLSPYFKRNFALLRIHAEELARFHAARLGKHDVSLAMIYEALCMTGELGENEVRWLMELEACAERTLWPQGADFQGDDLLPIEQRLAKDNLLDFSSQLIVGASRAARLSCQLIGPAALGAGLGGPILMPYVEWLLRRSQVLGFKRLYFIARDGYILKLLADVLIREQKLPIKTYYIHGSRRAWRMPSYKGGKGDLLEIVGWSHNHHIFDAEGLADLLRIPEEILRTYLPPEFRSAGLKLSGIAVSACVYYLDENDKFRMDLAERQSDARKLVRDYLQQEIDCTDDDFAFVELGGGGFTQVCLGRLMQPFYQGELRTFFYKMDRVRPWSDNCVFYDFFPSKLPNDLTIEMVCRSPEGQTEGYRRQGSKVVPVQRKGEAEKYLKHGYGEYIRGITEFAKAYAKTADLPHEPSLAASLNAMNWLSSEKDGDALEFFGGLPNSVTGREQQVPEFAPPLSKEQVRDIYIRHPEERGEAYYKGTDYAMSVWRSVPEVQRLVCKYRTEGAAIRQRWLRLYRLPDTRGIQPMAELPYSCLGQRWVIYGAGKRGQEMYAILSRDECIKVVQWLDRDYQQLLDKLPVTGDISDLAVTGCDCVLVAIAKQGVAEEVKQEIIRFGIKAERIYSLQDLHEWQHGLSVCLLV